jgi:hypothetical protein
MLAYRRLRQPDSLSRFGKALQIDNLAKNHEPVNIHFKSSGSEKP